MNAALTAQQCFLMNSQITTMLRARFPLDCPRFFEKAGGIDFGAPARCGHLLLFFFTQPLQKAARRRHGTPDRVFRPIMPSPLSA